MPCRMKNLTGLIICRSIPSLLGIKKAIDVSEYLHFLSFASIFMAGILGHFSWFYWAGVAIFAYFLVYQHTIGKTKRP